MRLISQILRKSPADRVAEFGGREHAGWGWAFAVLIAGASFAPARAQKAASRPAGLDAAALARSAEDALNRKDFPSAVKALKSLVEIEPDSDAAWLDLGYAYSGLHDSPEAVSAYEKTIALKPDLFAARINLGILLLESHQPQAALVHLEKAVMLKPEHARAHLYYGRALAQAGQPEAAEKQFRQTIALNPQAAMAHYDLGQLELSEKHYTDALAEFQQAAQMDAALSQASLGAALASEGLRQNAQAAAYFEQYLAAKPDDQETRFHLARIYLSQGKNDRAQAALERVYQTNPKLPGVAAALGDVNALLKNFLESEKFYRQALSATPQAADLHRALGRTLLDEQKFPEAESEFRAALKIDPHSRDAAQGLASSLYLEKRYAEAVPIIQALLQLPNPPHGYYFILATCYDDLRDRPQALAAYEQFLELSHGESPDQEWQARQRAKLLRRELRK